MSTRPGDNHPRMDRRAAMHTLLAKRDGLLLVIEV